MYKVCIEKNIKYQISLVLRGYDDSHVIGTYNNYDKAVDEAKQIAKRWRKEKVFLSVIIQKVETIGHVFA